jgi:hypothetical protein
MFVDMRGSTKELAETRLPFEIVFLLDPASQAVVDTGGLA